MARVLLAAEAEPASNRTVARLALETVGHAVEEVHDGESALAQAEATRPDLLVLDTALPGLDGFQVLTRLRRHPALRYLPVVMLSTLPRSLGGELARVLGAERFLSKPFSATDLATAVEAALASRVPGAATPPAPSPPWAPAEWRARPAIPPGEARQGVERGPARPAPGSSPGASAPRTGAAPAAHESVVELPAPSRRRPRAPRPPSSASGR
ncbi:MAG TPA: response regulator [Chloroflexota bacterium]|nr:response regulator [Chloroflexota bacterium]